MMTSPPRRKLSGSERIGKMAQKGIGGAPAPPRPPLAAPLAVACMYTYCMNYCSNDELQYFIKFTKIIETPII